MKLLKKILVLMLVFTIIGVVACNSSKEKSSVNPEVEIADPKESKVETAAPEESKNGDESVEINVAVGSFATKSVYEAIDKFKEIRPNATINVLEIPFGSLYEKLNTAFATNTGAYDIAIYPSNWLSEFIQGDYIISLDNYVSDKENWDTLISAYYDMQLFEDSIYAIPLDGDSIILYYRKDAFENPEYKADFEKEYGYELAPPKTWTEYIEIAKFFNGWDWDGDGETDYGTIEAMAPKDVGANIFLTHAITYAAHPDYPGYAFFNPETMEPMVKNEAYERALNEYKEILDLGPPNMINYGGGEQRAAFPAGEAAMAIDWHDTGIMAQNPENSVIKENVGYALVPGTYECWNPETNQWDKFDEVQYAPYLAFSGWTSSITSTCSNPKVAAEFLCFMDNDENSLKAVTTDGTARNPYRIEHLTDPKAWEESELSFYKPQEYLDTILESYTHPNIQLDLRIPKAGSYLDSLDLAVSQALSDSISIKDALGQAYDSWNEITQSQGLENQQRFYLNTYKDIKTGEID